MTDMEDEVLLFTDKKKEKGNTSVFCFFTKPCVPSPAKVLLSPPLSFQGISGWQASIVKSIYYEISKTMLITLCEL